MPPTAKKTHNIETCFWERKDRRKGNGTKAVTFFFFFYTFEEPREHFLFGCVLHLVFMSYESEKGYPTGSLRWDEQRYTLDDLRTQLGVKAPVIGIVPLPRTVEKR